MTTLESVLADFEERYKHLNYGMYSSPKGVYKDALPDVKEFISRSLKTLASELRLPYHASFTTAELANTEETKLQAAKNRGWNDAVDVLLSEIKKRGLE